MKILYFTLFITVGLNAFGQPVQGFFLNEVQPKTASMPPFTEFEKPTRPATTTIVVNAEDKIAQVSKYVFGNNANVYMSQMVDQPVLLSHISALSPNVIRFPGGNLSSIYFWNENKDQPPVDAPTTLLDASGVEQSAGYWYGKNSENWTLSVDNYYQMLEQTQNTGIITVNYGYARYSTAQDPVASAAHLAANWVRYDNGRTKFWEIGNESNGTWQAGYRIKTTDNKDGQPEIITGALYGRHFRVFADSMRAAAAEQGNTIYIGAQLLQEAPASWWNDTDKNWNTGVFQEAVDIPDYYIVHSYYTPYDTDSRATDILATATTVTNDMMNYVTQSQIAAGVVTKPIALTEWNIFAVRSKQQASYINGMHAALVLGELIKNKYGLACRWDLANGWANGDDHGMFNSGDEPGGIPKWNPRAAFYYMYYFQKYFGDQMVSSNVLGSTDIVSYASSFNSKEIGLVVVNKGSEEEVVTIDVQNYGYGERFFLYTLTGGTDNGEFSLKVFVNNQGPALASGGPANYETLPAESSAIAGGIKFVSPPRSVHYILIEQGENIITDVLPEEDLKLKIFPNPARHAFSLQLPSTGFSTVEFYDESGRLAYQGALDSSQTMQEINKVLLPGLYYIRLMSSKNVLFSKIVIE